MALPARLNRGTTDELGMDGKRGAQDGAHILSAGFKTMSSRMGQNDGVIIFSITLSDGINVIGD